MTYESTLRAFIKEREELRNSRERKKEESLKTIAEMDYKELTEHFNCLLFNALLTGGSEAMRKELFQLLPLYYEWREAKRKVEVKK